MTCDEARNRFEDYLDGTLEHSEKGAVGEHVEHCRECNARIQSMVTLRDRVASLSKEITPGRDLWPAIAGRIGTGKSHPTIVRHDFRKGASGAMDAQQKKRSRGWGFGFAAAATLLIAVGSFWFAMRPDQPAWGVEKLEGQPIVDNEHVAQSGQLHVGDWLETDGSSKARLSVGLIGEVEIEPNTRLRLVQANLTDHRIELRQGTIHATIWAPPRLFFVETPSAVAIDLGCAYTLAVDESGASFLHVTSGYVALEFDGRDSFVPEGAMCATRPGQGPGTPFPQDASELMRTALMHYDFDHGGTIALRNVLAESRSEDALTLWHLLRNAEDSDRELVYDKLASVAPPPDDVNRDGILQGNLDMLERWGESLGIPGM